MTRWTTLSPLLGNSWSVWNVGLPNFVFRPQNCSGSKLASKTAPAQLEPGDPAAKRGFPRSRHSLSEKAKFRAATWESGIGGRVASSYFSVDFLSKSNSRAGNTSSANPQSKQTEMGWETDTGGTRRSLISGKLVVNSPSTCRMFSDLHALQAISSTLLTLEGRPAFRGSDRPGGNSSTARLRLMNRSPRRTAFMAGGRSPYACGLWT